MGRRESIMAITYYFMEEHYPEPTGPLPTYEFKMRSYSRWALKEVINRIKIEDYKDPITCVVDFAMVLDKLSKQNLKTTYIFSFSLYAISDLLDMLYAMG